MNYGMNQMWATPVLMEKIQDQALLDQTVHAILSSVDPQSINFNFQTYDILKDGGKILKSFRKKVVEPIFDSYMKSVFNFGLKDTDYFLKSWLAGMGSSYMMPLHNHSGAHVSAVFYLLCEEKNAGGELLISDPRFNANRGYPNKMKDLFNLEIYKPKSGEVVVMPGFLHHQVATFNGKLRLAMPVDLYIVD